MQWDKPASMGTEDLAEPEDAWTEVTDENGNIYYMNPATGQTAWMSEDEAARALQRVVRPVSSDLDSYGCESLYLRSVHY